MTTEVQSVLRTLRRRGVAAIATGGRLRLQHLDETVLAWARGLAAPLWHEILAELEMRDRMRDVGDSVEAQQRGNAIYPEVVSTSAASAVSMGWPLAPDPVNDEPLGWKTWNLVRPAGFTIGPLVPCRRCGHGTACRNSRGIPEHPYVCG